MARQRRISALTWTLTASLVSVVALAGCGGADRDTAGENAGDAAQEAAAPPDLADPEARQSDGDYAGGDDGGEAGGLVDTRAIIYTGQIVVRVDDVDQAAAAASALADRYGGFVGGDHRTVAERHASARLVLRIPSEDFTAAVDDLGELGDEESRSIETEDVTEEVADLQTRLATAKASVERTRALLEEAESITDVVEVEAELATREERLARLQSQQRRLDELTTLSTITAELLGPDAPEDTRERETGFLAGLGAGWNAFTTSATVLVTALGAALPFLVALGVPATAVVWWARRRVRGRVRSGTPADQQA